MNCIEELKKHVATVHCSNTSSLLQRKISNALLAYAYAYLDKQEEHHITIKELCNMINYKGHNYAAIKDALRALVSTFIEWNIIDVISGEKDWTVSTILASARIKGSVCSYAYSPRMRELLYTPTMYARINLSIQAQFQSSYGLALYENCVRYKGLPFTKTFEWDVFRKLMGIVSGTYQEYSDFKRRVLDKAVDEVNKYSDMKIEPEVMRCKRKIINIRFKLQCKERVVKSKNETENTEASTTAQNELIVKLRNVFALDETDINFILDNYELDYISEKINLVENTKTFERGQIENLGGYFVSALKYDYQQPKSSKDALSSRQIEANKLEIITNNEQKALTKLKAKYSEYLRHQYLNSFQLLKQTEKEQLLEEFEKSLSSQNATHVLKIFRKHKLERKSVQALLKNFIDKERKDLVPISITFEEYLEKYAGKETYEN